MSKDRLYRLGALGMASSVVLAGFPALAQVGEKAGVAGGVKGSVQQVSHRTPQANIGRAVASGDEIFLGDRIITGPQGSVQVMLLDGTTFTIGPNAAMTIDEFVYKPGTTGGSLKANLLRGSFRVITGKVGKQEGEGVSLKTPLATIGVRGSIVGVSVAGGQVCAVLMGVGPFNSVDRPPSDINVNTNAGASGDTSRAGYGCCITTQTPQCEMRPFSLQELQNLFGPVTGDLRQTTVLDIENLSGQDIANALNNLTNIGPENPGRDILTEILQDLRGNPSGTGNPTNSFPPPPPPPPPPPCPPPYCYY